MYFINSSSSVLHQPVFGVKGFSKNLPKLKKGSELLHPDYKKYINPANLRRMSKILRISVAAASNCIEQHNVKPDAIIVGTGLGCLDDTEKFLNNLVTIEGNMLPPTAFIQSTHNTIAGQISLVMQNHGYNMTHTQNTVSFEMALQDSMLMIDEGSKNILVGAADENIPVLESITTSLGYKDVMLSSGASFFILSGSKGNSNVVIRNCRTFFNTNKENACKEFLQSAGISESEVDLILYSGEKLMMPEKPQLRYEDFCGNYFTSSAFGMHLAEDILMAGSTNLCGEEIKVKKILLINNMNPSALGLILIERS